MVVEVTAETWEKEVLNAEKIVIVEFWHEECPYCQKINPIYKELAKEYEDLKFAQLNIRESQENLQIAKKYGIMGTPTLKFFCDGRVIGEIIGYKPKSQLKEGIEETTKESNVKTCLEKSSSLDDLYT